MKSESDFAKKVPENNNSSTPYLVPTIQTQFYKKSIRGIFKKASFSK